MRDSDKQAGTRRKKLAVILGLAAAAEFLLAFLLFAVGRGRGSEDLVILGVILAAVGIILYPALLLGLSDPEKKEPAQRGVPVAPLDQTTAAVPRELIAAGWISGRFFQLVPAREALHVIYLDWGDFRSTAADRRRVAPVWDDAALRAQYRRGHAIPWREMESLELTVKSIPVLRWHDTVGKVVIRTAEQTHRFYIVAERDADRDLTPAQLSGFFSLAGSARKVDAESFARQRTEDRAELEQGALRHPRARQVLMPLRWALPVVTMAVLTLWLLLRDFEFVYDGFAWTLVVLGLLPVVLATFLPQVFTVRSLLFPTRSPREGEPVRCDLGLGLLAGAVALGIRSVGFRIGNDMFLRLVPIFLAAAFVLTVLMLRKVVLRHKLLYSTFIVLYTAMLLLGAALLLNDLLDHAPVQRETTVITQKRDTVGHTERCQVRLEGQDEWIDVSEYVYDRFEVGDEVELLVHPGALGIPYTEPHFILDIQE